jgi:hypothetical protein
LMYPVVFNSISFFKPGLKTFSSVAFKHDNTRDVQLKDNDDDGRLDEGSGLCGGGPWFVSCGEGGGVGSVSGARGRGTKYGGGVSCDAPGLPVLTRRRRDDDRLRAWWPCIGPLGEGLQGHLARGITVIHRIRVWWPCIGPLGGGLQGHLACGISVIHLFVVGSLCM